MLVLKCQAAVEQFKQDQQLSDHHQFLIVLDQIPQGEDLVLVHEFPSEINEEQLSILTQQVLRHYLPSQQQLHHLLSNLLNVLNHFMFPAKVECRGHIRPEYEIVGVEQRSNRQDGLKGCALDFLGEMDYIIKDEGKWLLAIEIGEVLIFSLDERISQLQISQEIFNISLIILFKRRLITEDTLSDTKLTDLILPIFIHQLLYVLMHFLIPLELSFRPYQLPQRFVNLFLQLLTAFAGMTFYFVCIILVYRNFLLEQIHQVYEHQLCAAVFLDHHLYLFVEIVQVRNYLFLHAFHPQALQIKPDQQLNCFFKHLEGLKFINLTPIHIQHHPTHQLKQPQAKLHIIFPLQIYHLVHLQTYSHVNDIMNIRYKENFIMNLQ